MNDEKLLTHTAFLKKKTFLTHPGCKEMSDLSAIVKDGDVERISDAKNLLLFDKYTKLSDNPERSLQYLFIASITTICFYAIEGGLPEEEAFQLSEYYIKQLDHCTTSAAISALYNHALENYITRVHEVQISSDYSKPVLMAIEYIYDNLHYNITVEQLAEHVGLSASYFSALFKKEVGETIASYIRKMKIEAAKNMLVHSDYSSLEISTYLAFCSQSHFIRIFKQEVGVTPKEYRDSSHISNT